ncbi:hypothetical protein FA13DRAFT_1844478 [Coprinellus micaceus]|uniref:Uncharacterized protein n=1 Tax=Coprinellus micaceus TaxID=71717 RepID=A0A4Y7TDL8_COPMI|nr:hypothetical protein FA13DRAFT_1844478 [Coprinellus micaceus]
MGNVKFRLGQDRRNNPRFWIVPNSSFLGLRPLCGTTLKNERPHPPPPFLKGMERNSFAYAYSRSQWSLISGGALSPSAFPRKLLEKRENQNLMAPLRFRDFVDRATNLGLPTSEWWGPNHNRFQSRWGPVLSLILLTNILRAADTGPGCKGSRKGRTVGEVQCEVAAIGGKRGAGVPYDRQAVGDKTSEIKIMGGEVNRDARSRGTRCSSFRVVGRLLILGEKQGDRSRPTNDKAVRAQPGRIGRRCTVRAPIPEADKGVPLSEEGERKAGMGE